MIQDRTVEIGRVGFIGAGNMARALIRGIVRAKLVSRESVAVADVDENALQRLSNGMGIIGIQTSNINVARTVDVLVLAVKPQVMGRVLEEIAPGVKSNQTIISIAAGITLDTLQGVLGEGIPIVRAMPNTPVTVGEGFTGLAANRACGAADRARAEMLFGAVGKAAFVKNEALMDAVTAVSGSGPAYYFLMMEEMIKAAVDEGLDEETARAAVIQTVKGAAHLAESARETPEELRRMVTSPGGTTEAALKIFAEEAFGTIVRQAVRAAVERGRELARGE